MKLKNKRLLGDTRITYAARTLLDNLKILIFGFKYHFKKKFY